MIDFTQRRKDEKNDLERRNNALPPSKGGGTKMELAEFFVTGDFIIAFNRTISIKMNK